MTRRRATFKLRTSLRQSYYGPLGMKGRRALAASLALVAIAAVACEQALSIDGPVVVAPHEACGLPLSGSCQACVASACCTQASACAGEPSCLAHESCMLGCGTDYACRARCEAANPVAFPSSVPAVDTCIAQKCEAPCGVSCGVNSSFAAPDAAALCQSCIAANICDTAIACAGDLTCEEILRCGLACTTFDCQTACITRYDGGAFANYQFALASSCLTQCQFGSFWACVGRVSWPFAKSAVQTATLILTDSITGAPLAGVVAKSCERNDETCASPFGTGTTDANGKVTLTLPPTSTSRFGFGGYFDLAPPGSLPYLVFTAAPLSEPDAVLQTTMLSLSAFQNMTSGVGVTLDPSRGHVAVGATDCVLVPASGVEFSAQGIDAETKLFYYGSGSLDPAAKATEVSGLAFLFNVPAGIVTLQATPKSLGRVSSTEVVFTRPGALSTIATPPTP